MNVGESICGDWLRYVKRCDFVQYNLRTEETQGEIDVVGISLQERTVYSCEVAIHLVTGLQYTKDRRPDNVPRLVSKFRRASEYLMSTFKDYEHVLMLWSPVIRNQRQGSKYNQLRDVKDIVDSVKSYCDLELQLVINEGFQSALDDLRAYAGAETKELDSPVMRYLQIEERLQKHLERTQ